MPNITEMSASTAIIAALADLPNATSGLTAAQFKAKFDEAPTAVKTYINDTLIPELETLFALEQPTLNIFSVLDYGALGDGTTDDTTAIQSAITACNTAGGGTVYFPEGIYIISSALVFYSNMIIQGSDATIKLKAGSYSALVNMFTTNGFVDGDYSAGIAITENVIFDGLIIDGNIGNVSTTDSCRGINAYKVQNFKVTNCIIKDLAGTIGNGYGIITWYSDTVYIDNVTINRTDRQNICIWETSDAHISNCNLQDSYYRECVLVSTDNPVQHQNTFAVIENTKMVQVLTSGTYVMRFSGAGSGILSDCELTAPSVTFPVIYITDTLEKDVVIKGSRISGGSYGIEVVSTCTTRKITIEGCSIDSNTNGIRHNASGGFLTIVNNKITNTTTQPLYTINFDRAIITNNVIDEGTTRVYLEPESNGSIIFSNNQITNLTDATYAVFVNGTTSETAHVCYNIALANTANVMRLFDISGKAIGNTGSVIDSANIRVEIANQRALLYGSAAPSTGSWLASDIVFHTAPATGGFIGWVCVTAGTPGTWRTFGTIDLQGSATWDPGSLDDGVGETSAAITATGAALGDFVMVSAPYDLQGITCNGYVSATNAVKIRLQNETGGTIDLASGTWKVKVIKQ